jgi:ribonuclease HII
MRRSSTPTARYLLRHEKRLSRSGYRFIAGVDEAGRGPLAGPVVAGAVILNGCRFREKIDDSKKLSAKLRERAYKEIVEKAAVGVGIVGEKEIDEINIHRATMRAMELAVLNLPVPPDFVIVDGNMRFNAACPVKAIVRGDSQSLSIAAASIVAKVTRDAIMLKLHLRYPQYGFDRHKGYGTKAHKKAIRTAGLSPIHRLSFSTR